MTRGDKMARMTKTSKENILVSDRAIIAQTETGYIMKVYRNDNVAYVSDNLGIILYENITQARRTLKRLRPDLEPTTI